MCQTQDTKNQYYDSPINATIYEIQKMLGTNRHPISLEEGFLKGKKKNIELLYLQIISY